MGWQRYNPAFRFGVAIYNLAEDDVDKDRRQDLKMKGKHGLGGIRNGGFKKDAKFECGNWCQLELIFEVGDSAVALVGTAALGAGALKAGAGALEAGVKASSRSKLKTAVKESIKESADAAAKAERKILNGGGAGNGGSGGAGNGGGGKPDIPKTEKIFWGSWDDYKKVNIDGREYAMVGNRPYSKHAVNRMQPGRRRHSSKGGTGGKPEIYLGGSNGDFGRGVAPQFVEDAISSGKPVLQSKNGNLSYTSGTLQVITNQKGAVVTIITL